MTRKIFTTLFFTAFIAVIALGCSTGGSGGGTTCTATGDYTVTWEFTGSYTDSVSVAPVWADPDGSSYDPGSAVIDPASGWTKTEVLSACSSAGINITIIDDGADDSATINATLSIYVDGALADSVDINTTGSAGDIFPSSGAMTVIVGQ